MPIAFSTQTVNFNTNLNSPVVAFDSGTPMPESGSGPNDFATPIIAYPGQVRIV